MCAPSLSGTAPQAVGVRPKPRSRSRQAAVLVVEDEADLAELLRYNLEREGYACQCVSSGDAALAAIIEQPPDLVLLDRMLPGRSGDEVVARIKRDPATAGIRVIVLTAKVDEADQLVGFALGADDYVTKPFSMKVLLARTAVLLRRNETARGERDVLVLGPVALDPQRHEVNVDGVPVRLTATQFRLLNALMAAEGRVLDRSRLIAATLGPVAVVTDRTIDVHITALRRKLGEAAAWIQTVRGVGYTFRQPDEA
jgi:DNA-binding response OmpR family regulator